MAVIDNVKWELFCTWMVVFVALNGGGPTGVAFSTALLWHMADGKADVNLMVTFSRLCVAGDIGAAEAGARAVGQVGGGFLAAVLQTAFVGSVVGPAGAATDMTTLFFEAFATALFLTLFFYGQAKLATTEHKAVAYAIVLWAVGAWTVNPARAVGPHLLAGALPGNFWCTWLGPVVGIVVYVVFDVVLNGNKPAVFGAAKTSSSSLAGGPALAESA